MEPTHLGLPADEAGIVGRQVARNAGNPLQAGEPGMEGTLEVIEPGADVLAFEGLAAGVEPGAEVTTLAAADAGEPGRNRLREPGLVQAGDRHDVDRRDALAAHRAGRFVLEVLDDLPLAMLAHQVLGREDEQEELRLLQALEDRVQPVVHAGDIVHVEKVAEFLAAELAVVVSDAFDQFGDPSLGIVAPGVADKEVVGHCVVRRRCDAWCKPEQPRSIQNELGMLMTCVPGSDRARRKSDR